MRRRSRLLRVAKWVGVVFCLGIVLIAVASVWIRALIGFRYGYVSAYFGNVGVVWVAAENEKRDVFVTGLELRKNTPRGFRLSLPTVRRWPVSTTWGTQHRWIAVLPLWLLLLVIATPTAFLWWRDRRPLPGHCPCGYDMTGNVSGTCPECGVEVRP